MKERHNQHLEHRPTRRWWVPWSTICTCGLGAWPCHAARMLARQAAWKQANSRPDWAAPTRPYATGPLMTRGQAARSRQGGRW